MKEFLEGAVALFVCGSLAALGALFVLTLALIALAIRALPFAFGIWVLHKLFGFSF